MKRQLIEESVLFISILKWVVLATGVGMTVGLSTTAFLKILDFSIGRLQAFSSYYLLLPIGLFCSAFTRHPRAVAGTRPIRRRARSFPRSMRYSRLFRILFQASPVNRSWSQGKLRANLHQASPELFAHQ